MNSEAPMSLGDFQTELTKLQLWASHGCRDGDCQILRPVGMHTNGGCRCSPKNMAEKLLWLACELEKYGRHRWPEPVSNPTNQNTTMKQSDKAQLEWLASFYREAADTGREMQTLHNGKWTRDNYGPHVGSKPSNWRLEPVPQKAYLIWVGDGLGTVFETRESAELYCRVYSAPTQIQEVERTATESP